jgi:antitoxin (DNA-binding transcriptional repressor) of toxin-antitoxin stability system
MRTIELASASKRLSTYARRLGGDIVVLTERRRPVAALVPLRDVDREGVALATDPQFLAIMERARRDFARGRVLSLEEMRRAVLRHAARATTSWAVA